jgi:hypothetical protein
MPLWFLLLLVSSAFLPAPLHLLCPLQLVGWLCAPMAAMLPQGRLRRLASPVLYLGVGTLAATLAWVQLLAGRDFSRWETVSRPHEQGVEAVAPGSMREAG